MFCQNPTIVAAADCLPIGRLSPYSISFNGSDAAALRYDTLSETGVRVYVNEDTTCDAEIRHAPEAVSYLAFHGSGFITG